MPNQDLSIQYLKGIGPKRAKLFKRLGINFKKDLLYYFPRRYEDRSNFMPLAKLKEGIFACAKGKIIASQNFSTFRGRSMFKTTLSDNTGKIYLVWFNQPYLKNIFKNNDTVVIYGKPEKYNGRMQIINPEYEIIEEKECFNIKNSLNLGRIVPIYPLTKGLSQHQIRKLIKACLDEEVSRLEEFLPYHLRNRHSLINLAQALINIHFPRNNDLEIRSYRRLAFDEFFILQVLVTLQKIKFKNQIGISHRIDNSILKNFRDNLDFNLTSAQEKVINEILKDMAGSRPMHRLLQGDVGSGKTVVAIFAALCAIRGGYQVAFMVPTEILVQQHYKNIVDRLSSFVIRERNIKTTMLASSLNKKEKEKIYREIKEGKIDLVIGTHALLEPNLKFKNLGLVIIDEQHKFGVSQRTILTRKNQNIDVLVMTATPIPRSLAMTLYGNLDLSVMGELPPGRGVIKTIALETTKREYLYEFVRKILLKGKQVYFVYPIIEESEKLDLLAAEEMYESLRSGIFKDFEVGLVHGRLKSGESYRIMQDFKDAKIDILVSTTLIEVGLDIPNATCMVIEHTERFGLSQLHQLRGRVGRGPDESFCILVSDSTTQEAQARINAMVKFNDGFKIAEEDLAIRGPGDFFGFRQHGLPEFKIADPLKEIELLETAKKEAINLIRFDPALKSRENIALRNILKERIRECALQAAS